MAEFVDKLDVPVLLGVGAAFDIHSGTLPGPDVDAAQRPRVALPARRRPKRLWRRYLVNNPRFVLKVLRRRPKLLPDTL